VLSSHNQYVPLNWMLVNLFYRPQLQHIKIPEKLILISQPCTTGGTLLCVESKDLIPEKDMHENFTTIAKNKMFVTWQYIGSILTPGRCSNRLLSTVNNPGECFPNLVRVHLLFPKTLAHYVCHLLVYLEN